jgi:hypothetical protein
MGAGIGSYLFETLYIVFVIIKNNTVEKYGKT